MKLCLIGLNGWSPSYFSNNVQTPTEKVLGWNRSCDYLSARCQCLCLFSLCLFDAPLHWHPYLLLCVANTWINTDFSPLSSFPLTRSMTQIFNCEDQAHPWQTARSVVWTVGAIHSVPHDPLVLRSGPQLQQASLIHYLDPLTKRLTCPYSFSFLLAIFMGIKAYKMDLHSPVWPRKSDTKIQEPSQD